MAGVVAMSSGGSPGRNLQERAAAVSRAAMHSGALCPLASQRVALPGAAGAEVRRLLERNPKDGASAEGTPCGPRPNPFLPPDERLVLGPWPPCHTLLLNKFPIALGHLLLITRAYAPQDGWLTIDDWTAAAALLQHQDGLLFFNSSAAAGASQPHRHLQLLPAPASGVRFPWEPWLQQPGVRFPWVLRQEPVCINHPEAGRHLLRIYRRHLEALGLGSPERHRRPQGAYNILVTTERFVTIPRQREAHWGISVNALGFAGMVLLTPEADAGWQARGGDVLALLQAVGTIP